MNGWKLPAWFLVFVLCETVCVEGQWANSAGPEVAGPGGVLTIDPDPADSADLGDEVDVIGQEVVTDEADGGGQETVKEGAEEAEVPSFQSAAGAAPEQPTLRQVLESMKPPSLTDDESAAGSVWLHSKAGPDMAELADVKQLLATSSGVEEQGDTEQPQNVTTTESPEDSTGTNSTAKLCSCVPLERPSDEVVVKLVNGSALTEALAADSAVRSRSQPAVCLLVLFYGRSCPFSAAAAPHINALPRAFPDLRVLAVDALENGSLNTRFGIIAVPTVLLFHNGRPQARFNQSEPTLSRLAEFVSSHTQLAAAGQLEVTEADRDGPLPSTAESRLDWYLVAAWLFIAVCAAYAGARLRLWRRAADTIRNWWIEAEQHLHED